jgi:predicted dehydrogenase
MSDLRIALIGGGMIAPAHIRGAAAVDGVRLYAIADPSPAAKVVAEKAGVPWFADHRALLDRERPDAAIVATPNVLHVPVALDCVASGIPVLVEKPIADNVEDARRLSEAARTAGVPLLVGHQRRHNPIIRRARQLIHDGVLGRLVSATVMAMFLKPDRYFDTAWRRQPGGGPVLLNLIHEIDMLRFLYGEIASIQSVTSNTVRGFEVEDTAAIVLRFANGALGTITLSDTAASPWSWDLAAGENPVFFKPDVETHFFCGTEGSVTLPKLNLWRYPGARGWHEPIAAKPIGIEPADPYTEQLRHFAAVIRGTEEPVISGFDATRTVAATQAVLTAARSGQPVVLTPA